MRDEERKTLRSGPGGLWGWGSCKQRRRGDRQTGYPVKHRQNPICMFMALSRSRRCCRSLLSSSVVGLRRRRGYEPSQGIEGEMSERFGEVVRRALGNAPVRYLGILCSQLMIILCCSIGWLSCCNAAKPTRNHQRPNRSLPVNKYK